MTGNMGKESADAALVLGAAALADGQPSAALRRRALHAARLFAQGRVRLILASGGPPGASPTEAELIRKLCIGAGVPDNAILVEPCAATTADNIRLSRPILHEHGITRICLVTDRFHAPRAAMVARAAGLSFTFSCPRAHGIGRLKLCRWWLREGVAITVYRYRIWRGH